MFHAILSILFITTVNIKVKIKQNKNHVVWHFKRKALLRLPQCETHS